MLHLNSKELQGVAGKGGNSMQRREPLNDVMIVNINKGVKNQAMILADREEISLSQLVRKLLKNHIELNSESRRSKRKRIIKKNA